MKRGEYMEKRSGKYPNKNDFEPYFGQSTLDNENFYALPLSDPSESGPDEAYKVWEINHTDLNKPSAFSINKKIN